MVIDNGKSKTLVGVGLRVPSLLSGQAGSGDENSNDFLVHVVQALTILSLLGVIWAGAAASSSAGGVSGPAIPAASG